jgi:hypothetical protein
MITVLFSSNAVGIRPANAQHSKHEHREHHPAHANPTSEHHHAKAHAQVAHKAEHHPHDPKKEVAIKHAPDKDEHDQGHDKKHQHAAQEKKKNERDKGDDKKHQHTAQERRIVETLHKVVTNLHRADHDYDDQRHEALEHARGALHALHAPDPPAVGRFGDMTQAKSDAILREALGPLKSVRSELSAKGAPAHHGAALREVDEAVGKIHEALRIR